MPQSPLERRRFTRIASDKPLLVKLGETQFHGKVTDVSLHGLLFECVEAGALSSGTRIQASLMLDDESPCITLSGTIAHASNGHFGLHCDSLDIDSAMRLRRLVELNLDDSGLLERNLEQLLGA